MQATVEFSESILRRIGFLCLSSTPKNPGTLDLSNFDFDDLLA